jgi:hypothetical protein
MTEKKTETKMKTKIAKEEAEKQVQLLFDSYDLDPDYILPANEVILDHCKLGLAKAISRGRFSVENEGGKVIIKQMPCESPAYDKATITYARFSGSAGVASDKGDGQFGKICYMLGAMSGLGSDAIQKLEGVDAKEMEMIGQLFLLL